MTLLRVPADSVDLSEFVTALSDPGADEAKVDVVETPLSYLVMTSRHVYKVKRAVDRGEARFRSPLRRRHACVDELRLNRSLAPGVHLGVTALVRNSAGELRADEPGEAVEWAVKMRRLRREFNMAWLINQNALNKTHVAALAATLAQFYDLSPPETAVLDGVIARLRTRASKILDDVPNPWAARLRCLVSQLHSFLNHARSQFNERICDGRIVDGHGELLPDHIFIERHPLIVDRVEYSDAARRIDALDDLSLLTMELHRHDRPDVADVLLSAYRCRTGDACCPQLEAFYRSLHAGTRAHEVLVDAPDQSFDSNAFDTVASYMALAERDAVNFT
jgi:aminoglycoside phosphotransferase family enzyme